MRRVTTSLMGHSGIISKEPYRIIAVALQNPLQMHSPAAVSAMTAQSPCSGSEDEACARVGPQELVRDLGLGHLVERFTSAVQWNNVVDVDTL